MNALLITTSPFTKTPFSPSPKALAFSFIISPPREYFLSLSRVCVLILDFFFFYESDLFVSCRANDICKESKRQTINAKDVLKAIEEVDFPELSAPLRASLDGLYSFSSSLIT